MNKEMLTKEDIIVNIEAVCGDMVLVLDNNHDPIWIKKRKNMTVLLKCIKGGDPADRFTFGQQYELKSGLIIDNYGIRWVYGSWDNEYDFEVVK